MIKRITSEQVVNELRSYDKEKEWFEFKENWFSADELGEYISALANSAAIEGKKYAYFVWGVNDKTHEIVGTGFDFDQDINHEPLKHYLRRKCSPDINFDFKELQMEGKLAEECRLLRSTMAEMPTNSGKIRLLLQFRLIGLMSWEIG